MSPEDGEELRDTYGSLRRNPFPMWTPEAAAWNRDEDFRQARLPEFENEHDLIRLGSDFQ